MIQIGYLREVILPNDELAGSAYAYLSTREMILDRKEYNYATTKSGFRNLK